MNLFAFTTRLSIALLATATAWAVDPAIPSPTPGKEDLRAWRQSAVNRPRRILWNHDGGGSVALTPANVQNFLDHRLTVLADTQVDTIMFCTLSSGFGMFSHFTKVGQIITHSFTGSSEITLDPTRMEDYLDPLKVVVEFGHAHHMEVFWSMRMNDTHDGNSTTYGPRMFAANTLKNTHPEYLLGTKDDRPFHGSWTGVNYERPEIRELAFRFFEEICQNYDVDGIELDFFRHPNFFPYPDAEHGVTQAQCDLMTGLLQRIRTMADAEGKKRGRPILIAVRVPDSVEYCRAIGIDLKKWLAGDLLDLLIPGGYIRMNNWNTMVDLGHQYGVKVYADLDEPRLKIAKSGEPMDSSQAMRDAAAGYRGRAVEALAAKADGIYLFDFFGGSIIKPPNVILKEIGSPAQLPGKERIYFASYFGLSKIHGGGGFPHQPFQKIETLSLNDPRPVSPKHPAEATILIPETFASDGSTSLTLKVRLAPLPSPDLLSVVLNGKKLEEGTQNGDWIEYPCAAADFVQGDNHCAMSVAGEAKSLSWQDLAVMARPRS